MATSPDPGAPVASPTRLFYFEGYDFSEDRVVRSRRPATAEFIARFGFHALDDNSVEVDSSQVDADGLMAGDS